MCVLGFLHVCESVHAWIRGGTFKSQCQSLQWTPKWLAPMYLYNIFIPNVSPHTSTILPRCPFYLVLAPQNIEKRTPTRREFTIFGSPTLNLCSAPIWINKKESNTRNSANLHMGFGKEQQDLKQSTHVFLQKHNQRKRITNIEVLKQKLHMKIALRKPNLHSKVHFSKMQNLLLKCSLHSKLQFWKVQSALLRVFFV